MYKPDKSSESRAQASSSHATTAVLVPWYDDTPATVTVFDEPLSRQPLERPVEHEVMEGDPASSSSPSHGPFLLPYDEEETLRQLSLQPLSMHQVMEVDLDLQDLVKIEAQLMLLRRQVMVTMTSRAMVARRARHCVRGSQLRAERTQLLEEFHTVEWTHKVRVQDYQRTLEEARRSNQSDRVSEICNNLDKLYSEHKASKALVMSRLQENERKWNMKQGELSTAANRFSQLTELIRQQKRETLNLLKQKEALYTKLLAQTQTLMKKTEDSLKSLGIEKADDIKPPVNSVGNPVVNPARYKSEVHQLLQYVAYGQQDEAETLIKTNPSLLLGKGTVTDYSNRKFEDITPFQYALWALDWRMWTMLANCFNYYLKESAAQAQLRELETKSTDYGTHYDFTPLLSAYKTYIDNYNPWTGEQLTKHWTTVIGKLQTQVPAHVAQEYCHPGRFFKSTPSFKEPSLNRTFKLDEDEGVWYPLSKMKYGFLGEDVGILKLFERRRSEVDARCFPGCLRTPEVFYSATLDFSAVTELCKVRALQYEELRARLLLGPMWNSVVNRI